MYVKFWGVRGSSPCPEPTFAEYGGNTSCIEVRVNGRTLILDAGTGLRTLGLDIMSTDVDSVDLLLSHCHIDHICGFLNFAPLFNSSFSCHVRAGHLPDGETIRNVLDGLMQPPLFPMPMETYGAQLNFTDFKAGEDIDLGDDIIIHTMALNHTNGATAYRLEGGGKSLCYVTDVEHIKGAIDPEIVTFIAGTDLFIYDCSFTDEEYDSRQGRGHSTWQQGMRLANAADVETFAVFHHDHYHDDSFMAAVEAEAIAARSATIVTRDGMVMEL